MSTKTTFKRIALVAVAALGLGVLSVAPSTATTTLDSLSTLTTTKAAVSAGDTATATVGLTYLASAATDSITVKAALSGYPAGYSSGITLELRTVDSSTGTIVTGNVSNSVNVNASAAGPVFANFTVNAVVGAAVKTGTYSALIYTVAGPAGTVVATPRTFTFTVTGISLKADATSTSYITDAAITAPIAADKAITASKATTVSTPAAIIQLQVKNATASAVEDVQVYVTGPGYINVANVGDTATVRNTGTLVRAGVVTVASAGLTKYISVFSDGTAGVGTITLVGVDSGLVLGVETVNFSDTKPASVTAVVKKAYIAAGKTTPKVFAVTLKDAAGNAITGTSATVVGTRSDTTTAGKTLATSDVTFTWDATDKVYYGTVTGASTAVFGKAGYTITATGTDADETEVTTTAEVTFSDIVATKVAVTGPSTANVGDKIKVTFTATEKNGYPVADTTYEGAAANQDAALGQFGGVLWNTTTVPSYSSAAFQPFNAGETITTVSGVATKELYVPATAGMLTATWKLAGTAGTGANSGAVDKSILGSTIELKINVTSDALEAANAATTAALAANDAVDALAATVAKLVANLKAQITALTKLIVKIQKKVGA